ncbi:MAG TPA: aldose epimerase [Dyella sp.]|uniref:aldose epimerase family protein n=1 Tax=Dyella sp. TaxID=1869338 RepID=UPI002C9BA64D|nr:aldose epimerase [Dyella sp.]HUB90778.1 aldose epimerase [Dyella sp.]
MEADDNHTPPHDPALTPLAPGSRLQIRHGALVVDIAPEAGGRIAQIIRHGVPWLVDHDAQHAAMIAWGSYPMLPWAGRIRHGRFRFEGQDYQLPRNLGGHAIHGVALAMAWQVDAHASSHVELSLALPADERWPFGGSAHQRIEVSEDRLRMTLMVRAGECAMPATIGWHPWFRKPDRVDIHPEQVYPRDAEGIATLPLAAPPPGPWDDCFLNDQPVVIHRRDQRVRLTSDCDHLVVYDEPTHATCIEPQSGPPDAVNLERATCLSPHSSLSAWFLLEWPG